MFVCWRLMAQTATDPSSVLILVNDLTPSEKGTKGRNASVWVGEYYAAKRGIPKQNILKLKVEGFGGNTEPQEWDGWHINWPQFDKSMRQPVKQYLAKRGLTDKIHYIVTTYGIPTHLGGAGTSPGASDNEFSVDSFLAALNAGANGQDLTAPALRNSYFSPSADITMPHIKDWKNPTGWKLYLVTRLDGPSALIAAGLVDKAIRAEPVVKITDGRGYFDYRGLNCPGDGYCVGDESVTTAYKLAKARGVEAILNNNHASPAAMIHSAPNTLWAWGWYSNTATWDGYQFVNGAVGAMFTSYTANFIRRDGAGAWVPIWLRAGITATWGATGEPGLAGYTLGDRVLNYFWNGYTFGESAYLGTPALNWKMMFFGDPLYAPKAFAHP